MQFLTMSLAPFFGILHTDAESNSDDETDDEEDSILKRAGTLLTRKSDYLPQGSLDIRRVKDANSEKPSNVRKQYCNDSFLAMTERKTEKISGAGQLGRAELWPAKSD